MIYFGDQKFYQKSFQLLSIRGNKPWEEFTNEVADVWDIFFSSYFEKKCGRQLFHWPRAIFFFFHFWMHILIVIFLLNKDITFFIVCKFLFRRKFTFYISANLKLIYWPFYYMYLFLFVPFSFFKSTINGEHYQIKNLTFSGKKYQQHKENVYFIA